MGEGIRIREVGACIAESKTGGEYTLSRADYGPLLRAWKAGEAFYEGHTPYGNPVTIRTGDVVAVADMTPEQIAAKRADQRANEADDAIDG